MVELFIAILLISFCIAIMLVVRLYSLRGTPGAFGLLLSNIAMAVWILGYIFEMIDPDLSQKIFWAKLQYLGIATLPVWFLLFAITYQERSAQFRPIRLALLLGIPVATISTVFSNETIGWMWPVIELQPGWVIAPLQITHSWWFWLHTGYSYLALLAATLLLIRSARNSPRVFAPQSMLMLGGMLIPWLSNIVFLAGIKVGPNLDLTPLGFTLTNLLVVIGFLRYRIFDLLPVAYASIFESMSDGVIVVDNQGRIVQANAAALEIFKTQHELGMGSSLPQILPHLPPPPNEADITALPAKEVSIGSGKSSRTYILRTTKLQEKGSQVSGYVVILTDITVLKYAQDQMRLQVMALNTAGNGIVITNHEGQIAWVNRAFCELTGYQADEVIGKNPSLLKSGLLPTEYYQQLWQTILTGSTWHGEISNRRKDGSIYIEEMTVTPFSQSPGTITHFIAIKQDITERKRAEERLIQAHNEAMEANRLKTQLLANISHDIRSPLGAVIGYSEMLSAGTFGEITPKQAGAIDEITNSANQLLVFVNNLIGHAQIETGRISMVNRTIHLDELTESAFAPIKLAAKKKGLLLLREIRHDLPPKLTGDPYWIRQIMINLLSNAEKFTEHGCIKLQVYRKDAASWAFEVIDTGIGIAPEDQGAIFEPFQQANLAQIRAIGSGLGLSIVRELTAQMGGEVEIESQPGQGSTFRIVLPMNKQVTE